MLYAKVVLGLPVDGPFDYIVSLESTKKIKVGCRVWVNFCNRKSVGYVVGLSHKTNIPKLKSILEVIDESAVLSDSLLLLAKQLSEYYCCSWGEAIETILPEGLRKGRLIELGAKEGHPIPLDAHSSSILIHDLGNSRWDIYLENIKQALQNKKSVIIVVPDINSIHKAKEKISSLALEVALLYRKEFKELEEWVRIKEGKVNVVIGTRSAIFAPLPDLGLIIVDEESDSVYKQDQVPHYHVRQIAFMRTEIEGAKVILGSSAPSLESLYLARKNKILYNLIPRLKDAPQIKIIDMKRLPFADRKKRALFSRSLEDSIYSALNSKGRTLLFLNRRGFATCASCNSCGAHLKCPRCNVDLVYHFKENILSCHYCAHKRELPKICPECNSGYIKLSGTGVERIESELARIFPQARIKLVDKEEHLDIDSADIFISTQHIFKESSYDFDLVGVLAIDNSLNRLDFRASEKAFALISGLWGLTTRQMVIQTTFPEHHIFRALEKKDVKLFYDEELKERQQLQFPPVRHFALVKARGKDEDKVKALGQEIFDRLSKNSTKTVKALSLNPGQPAKLRGNFYWQVLLSCDKAKKAVDFLKVNLKNIRHSGIIITVDMDI